MRLSRALPRGYVHRHHDGHHDVQLFGLRVVVVLSSVNYVQPESRDCQPRKMASESKVPADSPKPSWSMVDSKWPAVDHDCPKLADAAIASSSNRAFNKCALRMSQLLKDCGWTDAPFKSADYGGMLCEHGLARGPQDLGALIAKRWGARTKGWDKPGTMPAYLSDKTGIILYMKIPGFSGQGHIDVWRGSAAEGYWDSDTIWFWRLT